MSDGSVQELKGAFVIGGATFVFESGSDGDVEARDRRTAARKRRRMELLKRIFEVDSTSSNDSDEIGPCTSFLEIPEGMEESALAPQTRYSLEPMIVDARTFSRRKLFSGDISGEFAESIASKFSDRQFKKHFRVSRGTMDKLHDSFINSNEYKNIFKLGDKASIPAKYYMMMFLWYAGKKCSYLDLSNVFNVTLSRAWSTVDTIVQFLVNSAQDHIQFPETQSDKKACAESFQEIAGLPGVIGCLVNAQVAIQDPKASSSTEQSMTSTIQAICDSKGRFLDVFVDASHKVRHSEILQVSPIAGKLREICCGRYHILGDSDYLVREWLLTPFKEATSPGQVLFNQKHRTTLLVASHSWDALQRRFEQLTKMTTLTPYNIKRMVIACCVLQNICLERDDCFDVGNKLSISASVPVEEADRVAADLIDDDSHLRRIGELRRRQIMDELMLKS